MGKKKKKKKKRKRNGKKKSKSPKTPKSLQGKKLIQGRLPFTTVDNKSPISQSKKIKSVDLEEDPKSLVIIAEIEPEENHNNPPSKPSSISAELNDSTSLLDISAVEDDKESDMNISCSSEGAPLETTPRSSGKKTAATARKNSTIEKERLRKLKEEEKKRNGKKKKKKP